MGREAGHSRLHSAEVKNGAIPPLTIHLHGMVLNQLGTDTTFPLPSTIFRCVALCSLVEVYWHFRGVYFLHLWGLRVSQVRNHHAASIHSLCFLLACCLLGLLFGHEDGDRMFLQNVSKPVPYNTA
jgi:hypothetical protein